MSLPFKDCQVTDVKLRGVLKYSDVAELVRLAGVKMQYIILLFQRKLLASSSQELF
ncbi:hypothetical protein SAMN03080603_01600 [Acetomicrobium thermoterrenum DSM 13490]|uniref:Uncharacterized protein n=1 Tax=Acetomicrobium thermoterrenum DSM 13490 TaxID=1120987 RepID=A0A1H3GPC2_9BACT|nr:hypothetical protein SAMN03080603_01600 [Acetomicrobium thermoterrenum DSM 13490]